MNRPTHHELQLLLGAYVLGGLDADDRRRLEEHLPGCQECTAELTRFAAVPGLLQLAPPSEPPTVPEDSLPRLISAARARRLVRRRRQWVMAAAAVVFVLAGVTGGVLLTGRDTGPAPTAVVMNYGDHRTVGEAVLDARTWGTEVRLTLDYLPRGKQPYTAWAVDRNGNEEQAATWTTPPDGRCSVTGATSILRTDLARVEIRSADGRTLLSTR
jgi:anti-sigma factor RsiW